MLLTCNECNGSQMMKFSKKTVVLTCFKIILKALYSFDCLIMYFRVKIKSLIQKSQENFSKKSGNFSQLDLWPNPSHANYKINTQ